VDHGGLGTFGQHLKLFDAHDTLEAMWSYTVLRVNCWLCIYIVTWWSGVELVGLKSDLDDQLTSFNALTLLVGSWIWPVKTIPEMTYNVSSGMSSLYSLNHASMILPLVLPLGPVAEANIITTAYRNLLKVVVYHRRLAGFTLLSSSWSTRCHDGVPYLGNLLHFSRKWWVATHGIVGLFASL